MSDEWTHTFEFGEFPEDISRLNIGKPLPCPDCNTSMIVLSQTAPSGTREFAWCGQCKQKHYETFHVETGFVLVKSATISGEGENPFESPEPMFQEAWDELTAPYWAMIERLAGWLARALSRVNGMLGK